MRNVPPGIQTMFSNGGLRGSDRACLAEVMVTLLLITSSSLSSNPIFLSSIHQNSQREVLCHFNQREKSFLDPSHSLGVTVLVRYLAKPKGRQARRHLH